MSPEARATPPLYGDVPSPSLGAVEDSWDLQCVSPWWQQVRTACVQSESAGAALLVALVSHRAAKNSITSLAEKKVPQDVDVVYMPVAGSAPS